MARTRTAPTLAEFAATQANPKAKCPVCALPDAHREQVEAGHGQIAATVVERWLEGLGHASATGRPISANAIRTHWSRHTA